MEWEARAKLRKRLETVVRKVLGQIDEHFIFSLLCIQEVVEALRRSERAGGQGWWSMRINDRDQELGRLIKQHRENFLTFEERDRMISLLRGAISSALGANHGITTGELLRLLIEDKTILKATRAGKLHTAIALISKGYSKNSA